MVLEHLGALVAPYLSRMAMAQIRRATRPMTCIPGPCRWRRKRRGWGEIVDVHAPAQVVLHIGEAVGQGEGGWVMGLAPASAMW
jgi:hypothetical protein